MEENFHSLIPSYKPLECTCVPPKSYPCQFLLWTQGYRSPCNRYGLVWQLRVLALGPACLVWNLPFSSLRHRLMKTKPHLVYPS